MHSIVNKHSVKLWYVHIMFDMYGSLQGEMAAMLQKYNCDVIMHMRHIYFFYITDISMNQILPKRKSLAKESLRTPYVKRILRCQHSYPRRWSARAFRREYRYDLLSTLCTCDWIYAKYSWSCNSFIFVNFYPCWIITSIKCWTCNFCHNC